MAIYAPVSLWLRHDGRGGARFNTTIRDEDSLVAAAIRLLSFGSDEADIGCAVMNALSDALDLKNSDFVCADPNRDSDAFMVLNDWANIIMDRAFAAC